MVMWTKTIHSTPILLITLNKKTGTVLYFPLKVKTRVVVEGENDNSAPSYTENPMGSELRGRDKG